MFRINRWDYVAPITEFSDCWRREAKLVNSNGGEWGIDRWYDEEFGEWCQMTTGRYFDEDGEEVSTSMALFPYDWTKSEMLFYVSLGEIDIDLPPEKYDEVSRERLVVLIYEGIMAISTPKLIRMWLKCGWNKMIFPIRMKWYDFEFAVERHFKAS